jgi:hypothetical protein
MKVVCQMPRKIRGTTPCPSPPQVSAGHTLPAIAYVCACEAGACLEEAGHAMLLRDLTHDGDHGEGRLVGGSAGLRFDAGHLKGVVPAGQGAAHNAGPHFLGDGEARCRRVLVVGMLDHCAAADRSTQKRLARRAKRLGLKSKPVLPRHAYPRARRP